MGLSQRRQRFQRRLDAAAVGADESAFAKQRAAEIARHYGGDVADAAVQQHGEHGMAGRAVRFAVVAHADLGGRAGRADRRRPSSYGWRRELIADGMDEIPCSVHRGRRRNGRDEATSLDCLFRAVPPGGDEVPLWCVH